MKRITACCLTALMLLTGMGAPAVAQQGRPAIEWRLLSPVHESSLSFKAHVRHFADKVRLWSGGRLVIRPVIAETGRVARGGHEFVRRGDVEAGWVSPGLLIARDPVNALLAGYPGGMTPEAFMHWVYHGGGQRLWSEYRLEKEDLMALYFGQGPADAFAFSNRPIQTAEDLLDLPMRTTGAWSFILGHSFRGRPVPAAEMDIPDLLSGQQVQAVDPGGIGQARDRKLHEQAAFLIIPGVQQPAPATELVINRKQWDSLPADLQQVVRAAAQDTVFHSWLMLGDADRAALAAYRKSRTKVRRLDDSLILAIERAGQEWMAGQAEKQAQSGNVWAARIYESYQAYARAWRGSAVTRLPEVQ